MTKEERKVFLEKLKNGNAEFTSVEERVEAERLKKIGLVDSNSGNDKLGGSWALYWFTERGQLYFDTGEWENDPNVGKSIFDEKDDHQIIIDMSQKIKVKGNNNSLNAANAGASASQDNSKKN